jgi:hypothetical protein
MIGAGQWYEITPSEQFPWDSSGNFSVRDALGSSATKRQVVIGERCRDQCTGPQVKHDITGMLGAGAGFYIPVPVRKP